MKMSSKRWRCPANIHHNYGLSTRKQCSNHLPCDHGDASQTWRQTVNSTDTGTDLIKPIWFQTDICIFCNLNHEPWASSSLTFNVVLCLYYYIWFQIKLKHFAVFRCNHRLSSICLHAWLILWWNCINNSIEMYVFIKGMFLLLQCI